MIDVNFFRKLSLLLIFSALMAIADFACAEEKYNPYPIIFVHGYDNVRAVNERIDNLWFKPRDTLKEFFEYYPNWPWTNPAKFKYWNEDWDNYMAFFDYRAGSNGDINDIADKFGIFIDKIIDKLPADQEKKVIIIAHSMGGLVARRLLAKYPSYQDKIERVIFIGTPHLGSPQASGVILSDRMIPELEKTQAEHHKWTGIDRNLDFNWQIAVYSDRDKQITDALNLFHGIVNWNFVVNIKDQLDGDKTKRNPYDPPLGADSKGRYNPYVLHHQGQGVAVGQLVVPDSIAATRTFVSSAYSTATGSMVETEPLIAEPFYSQGDTFLSNNTLAQPNNFKTIVGTGSLTTPILGVGGSLIFKSSADYSLFPSGNTFEDLNAGDGIVTFSSQTALGGVIYQVPASHIEEVNHPATSKAILQAIDDKPVIEGVYAVPEDWNAPPPDYWHPNHWYYLIFKVKDYLLADIEIDTLTIDGKKVADLEKYKGTDNKYKPYNALKQAFLKERTCDGKNGSEKIEYTDIQGNPRTDLKLKPGEFSVRVPMPISAQALYIKIKNPAAQYNTDTNNPDKFTAEKTFYFVRPEVNAFWTSHKIDLWPYQGDGSGSEWWPRSSSLYFNIQDSPTQNVVANVWLYSDLYNQKVVKKFETNYSNIPLTQSGTVTLPDGKTQLTLYSGGYDAQHIFATWSGETEPGVTLPPSPPWEGGPHASYTLKVTVAPPDTNSNDNSIFLLGSGLSYISADPTFIQPSRRESVAW